MNRELAACFDAPPPPPLTMQRYHSHSDLNSISPVFSHILCPWPRPIVLQGDRPPQMAAPEHPPQTVCANSSGQATRTDFSSLYLPDDGRTSSQLYPAFLPSAPSTEAMRSESGATCGRAAMDSATAVVAAAAARATAVRAAAMEAASGQGGVDQSRGREAAGESQVEVVDELLSENERLRLVISDLTDEIERLSLKVKQGEEREGTVAAGNLRAGGSTRSQGVSSGNPGAASVAARQWHQQQQQQQAHGVSRTSAQIIHIKCENCPQWLQIPGQAQLVYCPVCSHTTQVTANTIRHVPNGTGEQNAAGSGTTSNSDEGFIGFVRRIFA
ncbi:unnamed protein product [Choristocarpus tenellus]